MIPGRTSEVASTGGSPQGRRQRKAGQVSKTNKKRDLEAIQIAFK